MKRRVAGVFASVLAVVAPLVATEPATAAPVRTVAVAPQITIAPAPDNYVPPSGLIFNHPYWANRGGISLHVKRMIRSTQPGQSIRIAAFSVGAKGIVDALIGARNRGVSVQVIGDAHLVDPKDDLYSKGFVRLRRTIGRDLNNPSWVRICDRSCRGNGGNLHAKFYLFSQVTNTPWVVGTGSANLTRLAVTGQWNHLKTVSDKQTYDQLNSIFDQLKADVPANPMMVEFDNVLGHNWIFPFPTMTSATDPVMQSLNQVQCTTINPDSSTRRTKIRVNMYTWSDDRGIWIANKIRQLWDQGCDVAALTSIMSRNVRARLTARYGRGPIPIRKVGTWDPITGEILTYDHAKWVSIDGAMVGNPAATVIVSGSCNFSSLGLYSDEFTHMYSSAADVAAFNADFAAIWKEKHTFRLGPLRTYAAQRAALTSDDNPVPGEGKLWRAEPD